MSSQHNPDVATAKKLTARESRERGLRMLAAYPSGRQSLVSLLRTLVESGIPVPYFASTEELIDAILAKEFPKG